MKKIYLTVSMMMCVGLAGAQGKASFTANPYSGFGKMPLSNALAATLPSEVTWASNLPSTDDEVSWRVSGGTINDALKQMGEGRFTYSIPTPTRLLINGIGSSSDATKALSAAVIAAPVIIPIAPIASTPPVSVKPQSPAIAEAIKTIEQAPVVQLTVAPFIATAPKNTAFVIRTEDETLSLALRRWIGTAGYQLAWEAGKDFAARETTYNSPDLISAIEGVMNDTAQSNYPLHACVYDNKVIRILQISQGCGRVVTGEKD